MARTASAAVAHAPENAAYGLIALAPLGVGLGAGAMMLTLVGTVVALAPEELQQLAAELQIVHFKAGELMFRQGDAGDAMFVSVKGEIGLRMPGGRRRLASFAPGVMLGEMAVLTHGRRSADAVAESDVFAWRLSVEAFDRLKRDHPALAARLLNNIALHLAGRVRALTGDLSHWVSRAAAGRAMSSPAPLREEGDAAA